MVQSSTQSMHKSVRELTCVALQRVYAGEPVQEVVALLQNNLSDVRDRSLFAELTYGILRTQIRLHFLLQFYLPRLEKLPQSCQFTLLIALYSLFFLERIPVYALVSEAVQETKKKFGLKLASLVHAVLQKVLLQKMFWQTEEAYRIGNESGEDVELAPLARFYSVPLWLLKLWKESYGLSNALLLVQRSLERPRTAILINQRDSRAQELTAKMEKYVVGKEARVGKYGFVFEPADFQKILRKEDGYGWHEEGLISFQSVGSQSVLLQLGLTSWDKPIWDVCAGYGGKSAFLAQAGCEIALCSDVSWKRLVRLKRDFVRRKLAPPSIVLADGRTSFLRKFSGHILLDVPCSGLGVLARRPDLRLHRKTKRSIRIFAPQQTALLENALSFLETGCCLAYITCTLNPSENSLCVENVLQKHRNIQKKKEWQTPHTDPWMEGMYGVLLQRT